PAAPLRPLACSTNARFDSASRSAFSADSRRPRTTNRSTNAVRHQLDTHGRTLSTRDRPPGLLWGTGLSAGGAAARGAAARGAAARGGIGVGLGPFVVGA